MRRSTVLFSVCAGLISLILTPDHCGALDQDMADVGERGSISAKDTSGNNFQGNANSDDSVNGQFDLGGAGSGPVDASVGDGGGSLKATGPNGEEQTGSASPDGNANFVASTGDKIDVVSRGGESKNADVTVNGGDVYHVEHPDGDHAVVTDPNGKQYNIEGIQNQDVKLHGAPKEYEAKYNVEPGEGVATSLKEKTFLNFGPLYQSNIYPPDGQTEGASKLGVNPFDSGSFKTPLSGVNPSITVTVEKIKTEPCPEKQYADAFGDNGFKILDDSTTVELPPVSEEGGVKSYAFPGCFIIHSTIQIPQNINPENIGGQVQATMAQAGELHCDPDSICKSGAAGKPDGDCFYCDFCEKDQDHSKSGAVFGKNTDIDWNICTGKPGSQLPLSWKVCPQDGDSNYNVLSRNFFNMRSDIEATIRIYLKKEGGSGGGGGGQKPAFCNGFLQFLYPQCKAADATSNWQLVGCKKSVISYKINTGFGSVGSATAETSKGKSGGSSSGGGGNNNGGNNGGLFGQFSNLFGNKG